MEEWQVLIAQKPTCACAGDASSAAIVKWEGSTCL